MNPPVQGWTHLFKDEPTCSRMNPPNQGWTHLFKDELLAFIRRSVLLWHKQLVRTCRHIHADLCHLGRHVIGGLLCQVTLLNGLCVTTVEDLSCRWFWFLDRLGRGVVEFRTCHSVSESTEERLVFRAPLNFNYNVLVVDAILCQGQTMHISISYEYN